MNLPEVSVRRHVLACMLSGVLVLFGVVSFERIGVDRYPSIDFPIVSVSTARPGANPEVIDSSVTRVLETVVIGVPGIEHVRSTSAAGVSVVAKLEFGAMPVPWLALSGDRTLQPLNRKVQNANTAAIVAALEEHILLGTLLTALVVWTFLRSPRSTLTVAAAIPVSLLGSVALMYFSRFTFNTMTLLALLLLIGVVVDDAIVVLENVFRHRETLDPDPVRAANIFSMLGWCCWSAWSPRARCGRSTLPTGCGPRVMGSARPSPRPVRCARARC